MKKEYTLILTTTEEKPYNKFNHLIMERIDNELQCLDIVKEEFPKVTVRQTKKELDWLVNYLKENGFEVTVQEQPLNIGFIWKMRGDIMGKKRDKANENKEVLIKE